SNLRARKFAEFIVYLRQQLLGGHFFSRIFEVLASRSATDFLKSARSRIASKSRSLSSSGRFQPAAMASRRAAIDRSANAAASVAFTPDFGSFPSSASSASALARSNRVPASK